MDWTQIETRWAVMARRIRADVKCGRADAFAPARVDVAADGAIRDASPRSVAIKDNIAAAVDTARARSTVASR